MKCEVQKKVVISLVPLCSLVRSL